MSLYVGDFSSGFYSSSYNPALNLTFISVSGTPANQTVSIHSILLFTFNTSSKLKL